MATPGRRRRLRAPGGGLLRHPSMVPDDGPRTSHSGWTVTPSWWDEGVVAPVILRTPPPPAAHPVLDPAQQRVVEHRSGSLIALGAPGTGRSLTLAESVAARLADGVPAEAILVLAFDRTAARDLRDRIAARGGGGAMPTVTTFHAFAFSLVTRAMAQDPDAVLPRLLSGAEEDVRIRELLLGAVADGEIDWPEELTVALPTLGLANDVRAFLARVRELAIDPAELVEAGHALEHPVWPALARFAEMEDEVMALEGVIDYSRLISLAGQIAASPEAASLRSSLQCVYVDDAHEADPLQVRLIQALATPCVVAFTDPDTSVYRFRGADREAIFRLGDAQVVVLDQCHRGGPRLRAAIAAVQRGSSLASLPADVLRRYRSPAAGDTDDAVSVISYDSAGDLAANVGHDLRQRHLAGMSWRQMAVLVRGKGDVDLMRRSLDIAGVPARVLSDDVPLRAEPAVAVLLTALEAALDPGSLAPEVAVEVISGPLGSIDPVDLRVLMRALRHSFRQVHPASQAPAGTLLLAAELRRAIEGEAATSVNDEAVPVLQRVRRVGELLGAARRQALDGALPGDILWILWQGSGDERSWPERLRRAALSGHRPSSHDLDAVGALFDAAERFSERYAGVVGAPAFLASLTGQRVPAEAVSAREADSPAVVIATAHLAVGRSWDHVVIVGAQEGAWPSLRGRSSVLHIEQLDAIVSGTAFDSHALARHEAAQQVAEERRLFALALSRASRSVCVAVVAAEQLTGDQPSRFVDDLGVAVQHAAGRPPRPLTLEGLVAELRTVAQDPASSEALRIEAARRLAGLSDAAEPPPPDQGERLAPLADPAAWWGLLDRTTGVAPVRPADLPVALSASALEGLQACPRRWFLQREVHADSPRSDALSFGSIVHALAEAVARGELPADPEVLVARAELVWPHLAFEAPWRSDAERLALLQVMRRFCDYHRTSQRTVAASEQRFEVSLPLASIEGELPDVDASVVVRGAIDRVEVDDDGRAFAVDLKTGKVAPSEATVAQHAQLAVYQAAILGGGLEDVLGPDAEPGGASLVQLRIESSRSPGVAKVQEQAALPCDDPAEAPIVEALRAAVIQVRSESFEAVPSGECRRCSFSATCPAQPMAQEVLP